MIFKYNIFGYDKEGFNRDGYNKLGFDRSGFDKNGFNKYGFNKFGYDKKGYDAAGYNKDGYDIAGYDKSGFDKFGFNAQGFNKDGFNKLGYDINGYNKEGYDRNGFDKYGFNKFGYDKKGYDATGYDKDGYDKFGFDNSGFNAEGFDREGFNLIGYNKEGYDRNGFDEYGFDKLGYDREGYNKNGYNITGYDKLGFDKLGFDTQGFNKEGFNKLGYDINGYNKEGYDKFGFDEFGFDKSGYDKEGYKKDGYNKFGYNRDGKRFVDNDKLFEIIKLAYESPNSTILHKLGDAFHIGSYGIKSFELGNYLYDLANGRAVAPKNQYYLTPKEEAFIKNQGDSSDNAFKSEQKHLEEVKNQLDKDIEIATDRIQQVDNELWWMDYEQKNEWREIIEKNKCKEEIICTYKKIKKHPYYARMDINSKNGREAVYIGEEPYICRNADLSISSVWSEIGKRYREKRLKSFNYNSNSYEIQLRRNIDIKDGELIDIFDEYNISSKTSQENITDLYLLRVLEEKKGEKNISNIIRSIQLNQNTIIDYDFQKNLLVQGCAGSGKTMILLHRLANMKFNYPDMNYEKVKIITPNSNFNLFIDDLSKNLNIDQIPKMTLAEYWADIIYRYRLQSGATSEYVENITIDKTEVDIRKIIYSSDFALKLEEIVNAISEKGLKYQKTISEGARDEFGETIRGKDGRKVTKSKVGAQVLINDAIQKTFEHFRIDIDASDKTNTECVLYARALGIYYYYGQKPLLNRDNLLCVDEGQDISLLQYGLMLRVNGNKVKLNVYGDINQQIPSGCNINTWDSLLKYIDAEKFVLNENYRNSEEIVRFYNSNLRISNKSFGLKTKEVETISKDVFLWRVLLNLLLKNRTAIICDDFESIPDELKSYCSYNDLSAEKKAIVLTVKQSKGLEYDTVFVFDKNLNENEKYIAYTRALSELYIIK